MYAKHFNLWINEIQVWLKKKKKKKSNENICLESDYPFKTLLALLTSCTIPRALVAHGWTLLGFVIPPVCLPDFGKVLEACQTSPQIWGFFSHIAFFRNTPNSMPLIYILSSKAQFKPHFFYEDILNRTAVILLYTRCALCYCFMIFGFTLLNGL